MLKATAEQNLWTSYWLKVFTEKELSLENQSKTRETTQGFNIFLEIPLFWSLYKTLKHQVVLSVENILFVELFKVSFS